MKDKLYIYDGYGTLKYGSTLQWLNRHVSEIAIKRIVPKDIIDNQILQKNPPKAIIFPGGDFWCYNIHLAEKGREAIRNYVALGGTYYGFCAGAYYASEKVDYTEPGKTARLSQKHGQLGLFEGTAVGRVIDFNSDGNLKYLAKISYGENKNAGVFYFKGPYFRSSEEKGVDVLADFEGKTNYPAVIKTNFGKGKVVLSSVHPECGVDVLKDFGLQGNQDEIDDFSRFLLQGIRPKLDSFGKEKMHRQEILKPSQ